jgi:hypothetical protein
MKVTTHTRRMLQLQTILFVLLFLVVIGLLGWLSTRYVYEADWTASGRNTLSEASVALLREIPGEVRIAAWAREAPPLVRRGIADLVARYQRHKPDIRLEFINPDREPQRARELGIADGELVISYGDREERLRDVSESGLTNALQRLARGGGRRLLFLAGHGERNPDGRADHDYTAWAEQLRSKGIGVARINLVESPAIPPETTALVIAAPQSALLPGEVAIIKGHIEQGGNLLWMTEPGDGLHGLEPLAEHLGIRFKQGIVVDPTVSQVGLMLFGIDDPRVALVANYPRHELTLGFDRNTLFPIAGAIAVESAGEWEAVPVLQTLSGTWLETGEVIGTVTFDEGEDIPGPLTLGVALTRVIDDGAESRTQRIFVVADSDFLSNGFLGLGGNLQFGFNIANWLASDDRFIDIPVRTAPDLSLEFTPLTTAVVGLGFLLALPALLLGSGLVIWWRRRRR